MIGSRELQILKYLMSSQGYVASKDLQTDMDISRRQFSYSLSKINEELKYYNKRNIERISSGKLKYDITIIITTLKEPLNFKMMDDPNTEIPVSVILHILFNQPEKQLELLSALMEVIKSQDCLKNIIKGTTKEEIYNYLTIK